MSLFDGRRPAEISRREARKPRASTRTILAAPLRKQTVRRAQIPMNINISGTRMRLPGSRYTKSGRLSRYLVADDDTPAGQGLVYRDEDQWEGRRLLLM